MGRRSTDEDGQNLAAAALLKIAGRSDAGRQAFRALPARQQEEIQAAAAADRDRQANGQSIRI